ncbi:hypothetical protein B7P43_G13464 [Cryptotermes secundus]|uniref:Tc1-like transposase DDE domain-containing protein n=1 Tax=Cryptotermes secundus TaxID=105785 RepID=A0A2J7RBI6_9NEOP|nr:hypothetical protein B7P43_G13464 [Cryptotermes secundus]
MGISHGSVHAIVTKHLLYRKIFAQWVPYQLTEEQKTQRMAASLGHLQRYHEEEYAFLSRIATGDETWCHHFETINAQRYEDTLQKLRHAIKSKRPGMLSNGISLLHYNARPHTANSVRNTLQRLGWEVLHHPPYSPDLSPCDFHIFGGLKRDIRGHRFASDEDVCGWVKMWFRRQPTSFFKDRLISQWDKCINSFGDCF